MIHRNRPSRWVQVPERCSRARVRYAAPKSGAPLRAARRSGRWRISDGRLRRDHEAGEAFSWPCGQAEINQSEIRSYEKHAGRTG